MPRTLPPLYRLPLLLLAMLALLGAVLGGLARQGLAVPQLTASAAASHGALMISAFFGTVISLERAVALGHPLLYLAPLSAGLGGVGLLLGVPPALTFALFVAASLIFTAASVLVVRRMPALFTLTLAAGALCWLLGNLAWWLTGDLQAALPPWLAFLVLTIAGERLELTRMLPPRPGAQPAFGAVLLLVGGGCLLALATGDARLLAAALLALAAWLLRYDIARKTVRQNGLPRFIAVCLLSGYAWLALGAALGLAGAFAPGHPWRDAALHAVLLGFVFSMVIGHAPIVFPAVMRVKIPYHWAFYLPLGLLQLSLAGRVGAVLAATWPLRQYATALNALALLLFIATLLSRVLGARQTPSPP